MEYKYITNNKTKLIGLSNYGWNRPILLYFFLHAEAPTEQTGKKGDIVIGRNPQLLPITDGIRRHLPHPYGASPLYEYIAFM